MQTLRRNRLRDALLWIVVVGLFVAMYPNFYVSKREFALVLLAMFFTFGVQNFERLVGWWPTSPFQPKKDT